MLPILAGIVSTLISNNLPNLAQAAIEKGIDFVEDKTGVKLEPDMGPEQLASLRNHEEAMAKLRNEEMSNARNREIEIATAAGAPLINKITTPILALGTVGLSFTLFGCILFMKGLDTAHQNILIYVLGAVNAATVQVLSYYFGASHDHKKDVHNV